MATKGSLLRHCRYRWMGFGALIGWRTYPHQEGGTPQLHWDRAPMLKTLPDLTLFISLSNCSSVSFIILFNKLLIKSKCVPEFCDTLAN